MRQNVHDETGRQFEERELRAFEQFEESADKSAPTPQELLFETGLALCTGLGLALAAQLLLAPSL